MAQTLTPAMMYVAIIILILDPSAMKDMPVISHYREYYET